MRIANNNNKLTIWLEGRIDAGNAAQIEEELLSAVEANASVSSIELDMSELNYISSAGLRALLKLRKKSGKSVDAVNVSKEVYDVFEITGFNAIINVKKAYREISVDGLEVIGTGFYGTVYRIDDETIVKVYSCEDPIPLIENEKEISRKAFQVGIPTAISYDIVKVGDNYGSVFELLNAKTFHELIQKNEMPVQDVINLYVKLLKEIHQIELEEGAFPSLKQRNIQYMDVVSSVITKEQYDRIKALFNEMPEEYTVVHGDVQMKNVMMVEDEPMLIDMETVGLGNPVFDLAALYVTYKSFEEDDANNAMAFLGMSGEKVDELWERTFETYFEDIDESEKQKILNRKRLVAAIRVLYIMMTSDLKNTELGRIRINHTREHIEELLNVVDSLAI